MTPQCTQVAAWMQSRGRIVRYEPVTGIPVTERLTQIERLTHELWSLAEVLGIALGPLPTAIIRGPTTIHAPVALSQLTALNVELLATYHTLGLASALSRGVYNYTNRTVDEPPPNWRIIVDEVYTDNDPFRAID